MIVKEDALREYLHNRQIPIALNEQILPELSAGARLALCLRADFSSAKPVMYVLDGGRELHGEQINPLIGLREYQARNLANAANLPREQWAELIAVAHRLYGAFIDADAMLLELNPLAVLPDGHLTVLGGKLVIDDYALYRQPTLAAHLLTESPTLAQAHAAGIRYVGLHGKIACLSNGAGLGMAAMDMIAHYSDGEMRAGNFIDIGTDVAPEKLAAGLRLGLADTDVRCLLISLFLSRGAVDTARQVIQAVEDARSSTPVIVLFLGIDADECRAAVQHADISTLSSASSLREAARRAIHIAGER